MARQHSRRHLPQCKKNKKKRGDKGNTATTIPCGIIKTLEVTQSHFDAVGDFQQGAGGHVKMMTMMTMTANGFWYFAEREVQTA